MNNTNNINDNTNSVKQNILFFTIARMNPPTPGHLLLVKRLIEEALKRGVNKVYVILSKSNSDNENPLDCDEKIKVLGETKSDMSSMTNAIKRNILDENVNNFDEESVKNIEVKYICVGKMEYTPLNTLSRILYYDFKNNNNIQLFVIIGEDRQNLVDSIADIYIKNTDYGVKMIDTIILKREDMKKFKELDKSQLETLDMKTVPLGAFSASFVRKIVKYGLKEKFFELYRPYLQDEMKIEQLYNLILEGLKKNNPKPKYETIKPLKYSYPLVIDKISTTKISNEDDDEERPIPLKRTRRSTKKGGKRTRRYRKKKTSKRKYSKSKK